MAGVRGVTRAGLSRTAPLVFPTLHGYRRSWLAADLLAAVTLLAIVVPEQLATARLAGMPPITGYYAFVAGTVMFALLGSNAQLSVGADSTIAPLFAVALTDLAQPGSARYAELVAILAVMVGVFVAAAGLLRFGWIAELLSAPIITGFLAGVAVIIVVHQLPDLLGLPAGSGGTLHRVRVIARDLGDVNGWTLAIGLGVLALIVVAERLDRRVPGALVGLVASTVLVGAAGLQTHGVAVLGTVTHSWPGLGLPGLSWSTLGQVVPVAGTVTLVVLTQTAATSRAFPAGAGGETAVTRDFLGVGAGNIMAGLVGTFPVNASPPRTAAVASASGRTQAAGLAAAAAVLLLIPASTVLTDVPLTTLAAVLIFVALRLFDVRSLAAIARFDRIEFGLALVTLLTVALVGVQQGIAVAVALAILDRTRLSARPQLHVLGRIPGTTSWAPLSSPEHPAQVPGVLVVLFATPLWYANATHFREQMSRALTRTVGRPATVVLDAVGMSDIDYTGSRALREVLDTFDGEHIGFAVARAGAHVRASLARAGLLARIGEHRLFASVDEAVTTVSEAQARGTELRPG